MGEPPHPVHRVMYGGHDGRVRATWRILSGLLLTLGGGFGGLFLIQQLGVEVPDWAVLPTVQLFAVFGVLLALAVLSRYVDHRQSSDYGFDLSLRWGTDAIIGITLLWRRLLVDHRTVSRMVFSASFPGFLRTPRRS